ncbi:MULTISPECIES: helix-turn-helix domain-containing protein [Bacteroides]|jgi:plasmid maintenance system antidote protein VapI|uniref:helix-turn-helix domain-containing protein n=1 Tax=Bacteroides TaxID=816 RepID=UPI000E44D466|nr:MULTISPECIES: helix-turn-helix transcriptional regulator [Bacteroides]MBS7575037.1 helix-turn-helix domain-containing protein [Bacteroides propionicigenes]RGM29849.1 XRE family transcriptional regulator [Bacteroides sp. OM08-17BH]RHJ53054.1 XRE family transcriptional regulator [Bacteroides sp. AM10-21B]HBO05074.1 transcriptional regulator [Bacteroides sp.]
MEKSNIYIGEIIRNVMADNQVTKAELARRLGVRPQSVDYMLTRKSIDTDTLYNVSRALNYDFAMLYSLREGQTNCDMKEAAYNVATAKILVELELKPEDLARLNLKKRITDVLK